MDGVVIAWTPTNWVTIFLMAVAGFLAIKVVGIAISKARSSYAS